MSKSRQAHIREYQGYFNTLTIDLGRSENEKLPTDERIEQFANATDPAFAALVFAIWPLSAHFEFPARYPAGQPAGHLERFAYPALGQQVHHEYQCRNELLAGRSLKLSPLHEPLFKMIAELAEAGKQTAKVHYNAPGWVLHHNTDLWRGTAPINASNHGIWVTGGAWLCQHLWEHYLYTQDKEFLKNQAYPIMKEAARFFNAFLVKDPKTGWLISTPSNSPEQGGLVAGPTMDHQIIRDLFQSTIQASEILKTG